MAESDALSSFDFSKVMKPSKFLKWTAGKPLTLRILTIDPVVYQSEFEDKKTGDLNVDTKFAFVVYNFTDGLAQILRATPSMAKRITELHTDPDFGANIRKIDIKVSPTGEMLERRYDIQVLPKTNTLTNEQIKECQALDLDKEIESGHRMSVYDQAEYNSRHLSERDEALSQFPDAENEEPINLEDIPF